MANIPPMKRCIHPTCRELIPIGQRYCDKHKSYIDTKYQNERQLNNPAHAKFYNSSEWIGLRKLVLMEHDYLCKSCGRQATLVDHIIPTSVDWDKRLDKDNLQPLCTNCHNKKTADDYRKYKNKI